MFSLDHASTDKPYYISSRADELNKLEKQKSRRESLSFGLSLPKSFRPDKVPEVKWVNWRWPRYECEYALDV